MQVISDGWQVYIDAVRRAFGDDVESDALVFSLFGEVCADLRDVALDKRLASLGVAADHRKRILDLARHHAITVYMVGALFMNMNILGQAAAAV